MGVKLCECLRVLEQTSEETNQVRNSSWSVVHGIELSKNLCELSQCRVKAG